MIKITKKKFLRYEAVRKEGLTNMYAISVVQKLTNLTRKEIFEIMSNYSTYAEEYLKEVKK